MGSKRNLGSHISYRKPNAKEISTDSKESAFSLIYSDLRKLIEDLLTRRITSLHIVWESVVRPDLSISMLSLWMLVLAIAGINDFPITTYSVPCTRLLPRGSWPPVKTRDKSRFPSVAFLYSHKFAWKKSGSPLSLAIRPLPPFDPFRQSFHLRVTKGNTQQTRGWEKERGMAKREWNKPGTSEREASYNDKDENDDDAHSIWLPRRRRERERKRDRNFSCRDRRQGEVEEIRVFMSFAAYRREMDSGECFPAQRDENLYDNNQETSSRDYPLT